MGAMGTSAPVTVTVLDHPSVTNIYMVVNQATSLYMQKVRATNPTYSLFNAVRIYISGLSSNVTVYNAPQGSTQILPPNTTDVAFDAGRMRSFPATEVLRYRGKSAR